MKKKIAFVVGMLGSGGTENFVINLIKNPMMRHYDITVITPISEDCKELLKYRADEISNIEGVSVVYLGNMPPLPKGVAWFFSLLVNTFTERKIDIVHAHMDMLNGLILCASKVAKVKIRIAHAHTCDSQSGIDMGGGKKILQKIYHKCMQYMILANATDLCGCSEKALLYEYGKRGIKNGKIIFNGIELQKYQNAMIDPDYMSKNFGSVHEKHIITVGRVGNTKNPWFIMQIIEDLSKIRNDFDFIWVGMNNYLDAFEKKARETNVKDCIIHAGIRNDVPAIMKNADILILPSLFEGLGYVLIEAQACGTYCVASDRVPQLADCGLCEFLSIDSPNAPQNWAFRISQLLDDSSIRSSDERLKKFDIINTVEQLNEIYNSK